MEEQLVDERRVGALRTPHGFADAHEARRHATAAERLSC